MKAQNIVSTAVLGIFAVALVGPTVLAAEPGETLDGRGTVTFLEDTTITGPTDPENPGEPVIVDPGEGTEQTDQGPLSVDFVSVLKFGENPLTPSAIATEYFASPTTVNAAGTDVPRGNYVQVTDKRAGTSKLGWKLTAAMTTPFTSTTANHVINAAQISFVNPFLNSTQTDLANINVEPTVVLESDASVADVADAPVNNGWGTYTLAYGKTGTDIGESVKLTVPASTPLEVDDEYVATITWTIANID